LIFLVFRAADKYDIPDKQRTPAAHKSAQARSISSRTVTPSRSVIRVPRKRAYGEGTQTKDFYVRRNKASITVRPVSR
jgi:hypothetical protein